MQFSKTSEGNLVSVRVRPSAPPNFKHKIGPFGPFLLSRKVPHNKNSATKRPQKFKNAHFPRSEKEKPRHLIRGLFWWFWLGFSLTVSFPPVGVVLLALGIPGRSVAAVIRAKLAPGGSFKLGAAHGAGSLHYFPHTGQQLTRC
jgi:hypothetical protein